MALNFMKILHIVKMAPKDQVQYLIDKFYRLQILEMNFKKCRCEICEGMKYPLLIKAD